MKDGGAAFPGAYEGNLNGISYLQYVSGMSLRDYFAGQALCYFCSHMSFVEEGKTADQCTAEEAYKIADAMIAQREKEC